MSSSIAWPILRELLVPHQVLASAVPSHARKHARSRDAWRRIPCGDDVIRPTSCPESLGGLPQMNVAHTSTQAISGDRVMAIVLSPLCSNGLLFSARGGPAKQANHWADPPPRTVSSKRLLGSSANWDALQITGYIYWARIVLLYICYGLPNVEEAVPLYADGRHRPNEMA